MKKILFLLLSNICFSQTEWKTTFEKGNGKYMVNLLETNRQILTASGVKNENITVSDVCTNCNSDLLWSHRATKGHRGTMSAFMCIKED